MTKEQQVRDTLPNRPAGMINGLSREAQTTFAGLFNGGYKQGWFLPNGSLHMGKAECEWHWPAAYEELRDAGLIKYHTEDRPHAKGGGSTTYLINEITERGWDVREDDLKWFRELMDAMRADEAA
jgi:hypothetical protein